MTQLSWDLQLLSVCAALLLLLAFAMLVVGVFFFQIRARFESLDLHDFESPKEEK
jgi:hypothetical protein